MPPQFMPKQYDPTQQTYAPRIAEREWRKYDDLLRVCHHQRVKREDILRVVREKGFNPT
jgi:hypothetical protein